MSSLDRKPILVAVGDSDDHQAALRFAAAEALRDDRPLWLTHVIHAPHGVFGPEHLLVTFEAAELAGRMLLSTHAMRGELYTGGRVPVRTTLRRGDVVSELVSLSRSADHVVMQHATDEPGGRVRTGHVGAGVARDSNVPLVSVPALWKPAGEGSRIVVGLDGTHRNAPLLQRTFTEAELRGASVTVLHAWFLPALYDDATLDRSALHRWHDDVRRQLDAELACWRTSYPSVEVSVEVPHMRPADALVAASEQSDLLLLGRRASLRTGHLGTLNRALIRKSRCPTLVVPQPHLQVLREPGRQAAVLDLHLA